MLEAFDITAGTVSSCIKTLSEGHILSISPGGVREAQFSDNYQLLWGNRTGYAKVALGANAVSLVGNEGWRGEKVRVGKEGEVKERGRGRIGEKDEVIG